MATAKQKAQTAAELKAALSWDMFDEAEKFDITLSNGLELKVDALTAAKTLDIASVVGGKIVEIFADTTEDMPMQQLIEVALAKLDKETIEELAQAIFNERRVANLPVGVVADLVEQYVNKVGIKDVFSVGKKIQAQLKA